VTKIQGIENMDVSQLEFEVAQGARFLYFQYCISILVMTFKRTSDIYFVRPGESIFARAAGFSLVSLVLGWWGIPWGPIWTISTVFTNARGGTDVTQEMVNGLRSTNPG
jgi:hypothetical protein